MCPVKGIDVATVNSCPTSRKATQPLEQQALLDLPLHTHPTRNHLKYFPILLVVDFIVLNNFTALLLGIS